MGYIMPVDNIQYQQYHNRVRKEKWDAFPIEKLQRIQFGTPYHQEKTKEVYAQASSDYSTGNSSTQKAYQPALEQKIYAEMTGIGSRFQAKV